MIRALFVLALLVAAPGLRAQEPAKPSDDYSLELPTAERLFRVQSESQARQEIRQAAVKKGVTRIEFPLDAQPIPKLLDLAMPAQALTLPTYDGHRPRLANHWGRRLFSILGHEPASP